MSLDGSGPSLNMRLNSLLGHIDDGVVSELAKHARTERLEAKRALFEPGERIEHVRFPLSGMVAMVSVLSDGGSLEARVVGREGMVGIGTFLGSYGTNIRAITQLPGEAIVIPAKLFRDVAHESVQLRDTIENYIAATLAVMAQDAACNRLHGVDGRTARALLQSQDHAQSPSFVLTQEFLAGLLGTRRPSVTTAAAALMRSGAISYRRGKVTIVDRAQLEAKTCECYEIAKRMLGITSPDA
jgi:CRP-like cAMP-binding protein